MQRIPEQDYWQIERDGILKIWTVHGDLKKELVQQLNPEQEKL